MDEYDKGALVRAEIIMQWQLDELLRTSALLAQAEERSALAEARAADLAKSLALLQTRFDKGSEQIRDLARAARVLADATLLLCGASGERVKAAYDAITMTPMPNSDADLILRDIAAGLSGLEAAAITVAWRMHADLGL